MSWTKSNETDFYSYFVSYSSSPNGSNTVAAIITNINQTTFTIPNLSENTTYYFNVQDRSSNGELTSNICEVTTARIPEVTITSLNSNAIKLSWKSYDTYTLAMPFYCYGIQMSLNGSEFSTLATINDTSQTSFEVADLKPNTSYQFRMYDAVGVLGQFQTFSNIVTPPTGSALEYWPFALIIIVIIALTTLFVFKKRKRIRRTPKQSSAS